MPWSNSLFETQDDVCVSVHFSVYTHRVLIAHAWKINKIYNRTLLFASSTEFSLIDTPCESLIKSDFSSPSWLMLHATRCQSDNIRATRTNIYSKCKQFRLIWFWWAVRSEVCVNQQWSMVYVSRSAESWSEIFVFSSTVFICIGLPILTQFFLSNCCLNFIWKINETWTTVLVCEEEKKLNSLRLRHFTFKIMETWVFIAWENLLSVFTVESRFI